MGEVEKSSSTAPPERATPRAQEQLPGLRLMRIGRALVLVSTGAVALLGVMIVGGLALFGVQGLKPEAQVSAGTLFELLKIPFAVVAGVGGLVALVLTYRRQKVAEAPQVLAECRPQARGGGTGPRGPPATRGRGACSHANTTSIKDEQMKTDTEERRS
ncbi:hypothetical protein [Planotetraspora sp. GP83]|uniref:hypothetical protein n=1 Tax=Planotetraspora sp. GP83 TaxID=3156264 RepID=UPI003511D458